MESQFEASPCPELETRRGFHVRAIHGLGALIGAALGLPAAAYLLIAPRSRGGKQWTEVVETAKLAVGQPEEVVYRRNRIDGWKVSSEKASAWIVRLSENEIVAFAPQCTHLGCAYHWDERSKNFLCPCHTSAFSVDGKVLTGPAPRPLDRHAVKIEKGRLFLGEIRAAGTAQAAVEEAPAGGERA